MEQMNEDFVSNTLVETSARHDDASSAGANQQQSEMSQDQSEAIDRSRGAQQPIETIRNRDDKVGRNDPCPCGSGKKIQILLLAKTRLKLAPSRYQENFCFYNLRPPAIERTPLAGLLLNINYTLFLLVASPWLIWRFFAKGKNKRGWHHKLGGRVRPRQSGAITLHLASRS